MNLHHHPELLQRLAAAHALGTLRGGARRRLEQLARQRPEVRAAVLAWQHRLGALGELQPSVALPDGLSERVWARVQAEVQADLALAPRVAAVRRGGEPDAADRRWGVSAAGLPWWSRLAVWRGLGLAGALATVAAVGVAVWQAEQHTHELRQHGQVVAALQADLAQASLAARQARAGRITYVAVMADAQGRVAGPEILVTFDAQAQRLTLQRVGAYREAQDKSLQLWALPAGGRPQSLGVLGRDPLLRVAASAQQLGQAPALAISLEPRGGVPSEGGPTGPVLFSGPVIASQGL